MDNTQPGPVQPSQTARDLFIQIHARNLPHLLNVPRIEDIPQSARQLGDKRFFNEIRALSRIEPNGPDYVTALPLPNSNYRHLLCSILGPQNTPYEDGVFHLVYVATPQYPWKPPLIRLLTRVHHPNLAADGRNLVVDVFREDQWCTAVVLENALITVASLLSMPVVEEFARVPEVAVELMEDPGAFEARASEVTRLFARSAPPGLEEVVAVVRDMIEESEAPFRVQEEEEIMMVMTGKSRRIWERKKRAEKRGIRTS